MCLGFFGAGQCFVNPKFKDLCFLKILWRRAMVRILGPHPSDPGSNPG